MRILIVCSGNFPDPEKNFPIYQAFIHEQMSTIQRKGMEVKRFLIQGKGIKGYWNQRKALGVKIEQGSYDVVHAHFVLSGLLAWWVSPVPVVVTFHGSDVNLSRLNWLSSLLTMAVERVIYVSKRMRQKAWFQSKKAKVIPCGLNLDQFFPLDQQEARQTLGLVSEEPLVLFASALDNSIKNFPLAKQSLELSSFKGKVLEIKEKSREEVNMLLNAADLLLLTSFSEGSPQIIKEAMACNCPIVATDVGDIREVIGDTAGCYVTSFDPLDVAEKIRLALDFGQRTRGREKIAHLDNGLIADRILEVYREVLAGKK